MNNGSSQEHGELQLLVDALFKDSKFAKRIDAIILAEAFDFSDDLLEVVSLLPPNTMNRAQLTDQLNSTLAAHGWGNKYGIVD